MDGLLKEKKRVRIDSVGVFLLGAVFLFLSIGLVMLGGSVYHRIMTNSNSNDETRTTFSYIANQIHRADTDAGVSIGELEGLQALLLEQTYGDWQFVTYLYYHDGALRELFVEKGVELGPEAGLPIVWLEGAGFAMDDTGLITAWAEFTDGRREQVFLSPRTAPTGRTHR